MVGVGGVILNPRGTSAYTYAWSLGISFNNQVEAYALLQGLNLAKNHHIPSLIVVEDSKVVIKHMVTSFFFNPLDSRLVSAIERVRHVKESIVNVNFYHILWENN
jgi:ribonuclease HI